MEYDHTTEEAVRSEVNWAKTSKRQLELLPLHCAICEAWWASRERDPDRCRVCHSQWWRIGVSPAYSRSLEYEVERLTDYISVLKGEFKVLIQMLLSTQKQNEKDLLDMAFFLPREARPVLQQNRAAVYGDEKKGGIKIGLE